MMKLFPISSNNLWFANWKYKDFYHAYKYITIRNYRGIEKLYFDTRKFHYIPRENGKWEESKE